MDAQSQSQHPIGNGISRRTLAQVLAAGAVAATAGTPAFAQQTSSMSEASPQDYVRDPTRWGSPEVAALFPGFKHLDMRTKGAVIRVRHGGSGPPLLLLHGYPNNHVLWHAVAAKLAQRYHVVCPDLRGYGDSSLPDPGARLINYSHPVMDEFIRCFTPKTISGACRDYRAGATINFEMDAADKDKKIATPLLVLWGTRGAPPTDEYPTVWRKFASNLETIEPLATGHYIQEEMPEQCLDRFFKFFVA